MKLYKAIYNISKTVRIAHISSTSMYIYIIKKIINLHLNGYYNYYNIILYTY